MIYENDVENGAMARPVVTYAGTYTAVFSYGAQSTNDLSLHRGDLVDVINSSVMRSWTLVRHRANGAEGYVPSSYIAPSTKPPSEVPVADWYVGALTVRQTLDYLLNDPANQDGAFLVRSTSTGPSRYAISGTLDFIRFLDILFCNSTI